jgi:hypothetical protein
VATKFLVVTRPMTGFSSLAGTGGFTFSLRMVGGPAAVHVHQEEDGRSGEGVGAGLGGYSMQAASTKHLLHQQLPAAAMDLGKAAYAASWLLLWAPTCGQDGLLGVFAEELLRVLLVGADGLAHGGSGLDAATAKALGSYIARVLHSTPLILMRLLSGLVCTTRQHSCMLNLTCDLYRGGRSCTSCALGMRL